VNINTRIAIVGAGAAGLTTAWFLKKKGYLNVTVLERSDRIGGKCKSLTYKGKSFDLGANYITSSYSCVRELAREFGAEMFTETRGQALDLKTGHMRSLLAATTRRYGLVPVGLAALRYLWIRYGLRGFLAPKAPGFAKASTHPDLCQSFEWWLDHHDLKELIPVFNIPITLMGYEKLSQIPAAYALTYMNTGTFFNLLLFAMNFPIRFWPKRFVLGYERLLEHLAAEVDVLRGAHISKIERGDTITVHYSLPAANLTQTSRDDHQQEFDALILACPLMAKDLSAFMTLNEGEARFFASGTVKLDPFVVVTYPTGCTTDISAVTFMYPRPEMGEPYVITQQYRDVPLLEVYSRLPDACANPDGSGTCCTGSGAPCATVLDNNKKLLREIGAGYPDADFYTYDEWPYFPHVDLGHMQSGYYVDLEAQQGIDNTYYVGGLMAFELVETITEYSRHLVDTHFGERS
jgi:hypothetical protein